MSDPVEWDFGVPASQVDVQRIHDELQGIPAIYVYAYLGELKTRAPTVYRRLGTWAQETGRMSYVNWGL